MLWRYVRRVGIVRLSSLLRTTSFADAYRRDAARPRRFAFQPSDVLRRGDVVRRCAQSSASPHRYSVRLPNKL